jgi:energy-coupling factor transport system ATP-binding protein
MPLQVDNISFSYTKDRQVLSRLSFVLEAGEIAGLTGDIGSGKSTLIRHLNGLLTPDSGKVLVDGFPASDKKGRQLTGILFQHPSRQLFAKTVFDDIAFGPGNYGLKGKVLEQVVCEAADLAGLGNELLGLSPHKLSGGQKKLACLAGVIACSPRYIILDEPFGGLDSTSRGRMLNTIGKMKSGGCGILIVSHDPDAFAGLADRMFLLEDGKIAYTGSPEDFASACPRRAPAIPALMAALRKKGINVPASASTVEEALEVILPACGKGGSQ